MSVGASRTSARAIGALGAMLAAALVAGPATAQSIPQFGDAAHLGVTTCAGSTCHGALEPFRNSTVAQNEYVLWSQKDKHSKAYKILLDERSVRIARNLGLPNAHTAAECLNCHADNPGQEHRGRQFQL